MTWGKTQTRAVARELPRLHHRCRKISRFAWALLASAMLLAPAPSANAYPADQCAADRFGSDLNCTANDVAITGMRVIGDMTWCEGGTDIVLDLEVTVNFSQPDRHDIGVFISNDGNDPQITSGNGGAASCSVSELPLESPFLDLDGDSCGDGNKNISGGSGSGKFFMTDVTVPCQAMPGSGNDLYVPFVVSWDQQTKEVCSDERDPVPNTKSKCNSPDIAQGTIQVGVMPSISKSDGIDYIKSGGTTTYDVTITNDTGDELGGAEFTDPAVSNMTVDNLNCTASGGATCPTGYTIADMQGSGITLPDLPDGGSLTFEIEATLTGDPNDTITNTGNVTMGSHTNSASDTNTIVDDIAITPTSQAKEGAAGNTVTYEYTVNNFIPSDVASEDEISLSAVSSEGWNVLLSDATLTVPAEGSANFTLEVEIPAGASIDDFDTTTITATSGNDPTTTASATANTTVAELLTLVPDNTGAGGPGQTFSYDHTLQNNFSSSQTISLSTAMTGDCTDWQATVYDADGETAISSVDLDGNGANMDIVVEVTAPNSATTGDSCVVTTTGTTSGVSASAKDTTTIKELALFWDPDYTEESYIYPAGNPVYGKAFGLTDGEDYYFEWYDPAGNLVRTSPTTTVLGKVLPDTYTLPDDATLGTWNVKVKNDTTGLLHQQTDFYVGPDHIEASHSGDTETTDTNVVVDLALHDRFDHATPVDSNGDLITANPSTTADPLLVTVTVDGSASIVSTSLGDATISGQSVTGRLDETDGTATMTITNSVAETVNVTPESHEPALYGSPQRDESVAIDFERPPLDHIRLEHNGQGLTCQPESITVKACIDPDCNNLYAYNVSVTLSPTGWVDGDTKTLTSGSAAFELRHTTAETVTLDIDSSSPSPDNTPVCVNTATGNESCDLTFHDSGFLVDVPTQTSCQTSGDLTLSAVRTDDVTQKCVPAFASTTKNLKIWADYSDPASGTQSVELSHAGNDYSLPDTEPGSTNIPIEFNADAEATYNLTYPDAGQLVLNTRYEGSGDDDGLTMVGNSTYVTKPAKLYVFSDDTDADCASGDATCSRLTAAGNSFNMKVRGACADNSLTPNFRLDNITLSHNLVAPAGGDTGAINVTSFDITDTDGGEHLINNQTVSEVGVFTFTATLGSGVDYFGETSIGDATLNTSDNIGRFSPHHFVVDATEACNDSFTYSGQPFTVTAEALNQDDDATHNYRDGFVQDPVISNAGDTANFSNNTLGSSEFTTNDGIGERTDVTYTFPDKKTAPLNITELRATDSDGITSDTYTEGQINIRSGRIALDNAYGSELVDLQVPMAAQYYDGDAFVRNEEDVCDNGVTISLLNPTDTLEVGDGDTRGETCVQDTDDPGDSGAGCALTADTDRQYTDAPDAGEYTLYLKAPDDDSSFDPDNPIYGNLTVQANTPAYLEYDWNDDATDDDPAATISFGRYRGDDRVIYWREKF